MRARPLILIALVAALGAQASLCAVLCQQTGTHAQAGAAAPETTPGSHAGCEAPQAPDMPAGNCGGECPSCDEAPILTAATSGSAAAPVLPLTQAVLSNEMITRLVRQLDVRATHGQPPPRQLLYLKSSLLL
jgi:hypothetical protein